MPLASKSSLYAHILMVPGLWQLLHKCFLNGRVNPLNEWEVWDSYCESPLSIVLQSVCLKFN